MKYTIRHIAAAIAFVAAGTAAQAATVVVKTGDTWNGLTASGAATLTFSADLLGALDTGKIAVTNYGSAASVITKDTDGYFSKVAATAPLTSATFDDATLNTLAVGTSGGLTLVAPVVKSVSSGGSLTVTDLSADLVTKTIYATIIGGNGVGTINNFALWNFSTLTGSTKIAGPGIYNNTLSGLTLTADGLTKFTSSLGLLSLGKSALAGIADYGVIQSQIIGTAVTTVPEPGTYALMGLGLVGLVLAKRRANAKA